ncbi:cytochrome P450 9e2-like [Nylanderia fulva]|uniref:cytochrome P450 9e2-like n=1 Tax=Nylanderia fulva TaxID=613905 RepID=UPI0010FB01BA|nr:cytochrome P450 9e2-like [Nylanderia fulva]
MKFFFINILAIMCDDIYIIYELIIARLYKIQSTYSARLLIQQFIERYERDGFSFSPPSFFVTIRFALIHVRIYSLSVCPSHSFVRYSRLVMELFSSLLLSPFWLLVTTLVIIGVYKFVAQVHHVYFYWKNKGIPSQPDSLRSFLTGWSVFLRRMSLVDYSLFLYNCFPDTKYYGMMEMSKPVIFLRDPELIKDILVKEFERFHDHRTFADGVIDEPLFSKNIFALRGDRWREMRNTLSPSFTANKMKIMLDLVSKCASEFVNYLDDHPELCVEVDTKQIFRRYTTDVIATTAFGISVNSMKDQNNEFYTKGLEIIQSFNGGVLVMVRFLLILTFPRIAKLLGMSRLVPSSTSEFFKRIVAETIKTREEQGIIRPDMIHLLMQARDKDGVDNQKLTLEDIVSQAFIFFLAGFETASILMCFVAHELAVNQDIQDRLREEVLKNLDEGNNISYESLSKMTYMDMVVSETLRKYPPVIFSDRQCTKSYELPPPKPGCKSVIVEPNHFIMIPVYGLHHDPKYYPNPDKFDPERFNEENKDNINPYTYLSFGQGPRKCIGNRFALMETKILVAHLLQKFILKRTEKTVEPVIFDKKNFNLQPIGGFWIRLEKRET